MRGACKKTFMMRNGGRGCMKNVRLGLVGGGSKKIFLMRTGGRGL